MRMNELNIVDGTAVCRDSDGWVAVKDRGSARSSQKKIRKKKTHSFIECENVNVIDGKLRAG